MKLGLFFALALLCPTVLVAGDVSLMPSMIEAQVHPGEDYTTVIQIGHSALGEEDVDAVRVMLSTEDWDMDSNGRLTFVRTDSVTSSALPWIVFSPGEFDLPPDGVENVRMSIIVPDDVDPGEYRAALIVQPRSPYKPLSDRAKQLNVRFRLATIIYLIVPPITQDAELANLTVFQHEDKWCVRSTLANRGNCHIRVFDSYQVIPVDDPDGQVIASALTETLPGLEFTEPREAGVLLPGRTRDLVCDLPSDLAPGHYKLLYQADAGQDLPVLMGETIFTIPGEEAPIVVAERDEAKPTTRETGP